MSEPVMNGDGTTNDTHRPPIFRVKQYQEVDIKLSPAELNDCGLELAKAMDRKAEIEEAFKEDQAHYKARLKDTDQDISRLKKLRLSGIRSEKRKVDVEYDLVEMVCRVIDQASGFVFSERAIEPHEQLPIPTMEQPPEPEEAGAEFEKYDASDEPEPEEDFDPDDPFGDEDLEDEEPEA